MSLSGKINEEKSKEAKAKTLGAIADLLASKNIDIDEVGDIKRISIYQSMLKDENGDAQVVDLAAIQISPKWESGPEWQIIQRAPEKYVITTHIRLIQDMRRCSRYPVRLLPQQRELPGANPRRRGN